MLLGVTMFDRLGVMGKRREQGETGQNRRETEPEFHNC